MTQKSLPSTCSLRQITRTLSYSHKPRANMSEQPQQDPPKLKKKKSFTEQAYDASKGFVKSLKKKASGGFGKSTPERTRSESEVPPLPTAPVASSSTAVHAPTARTQPVQLPTTQTATPSSRNLDNPNIMRYSQIEREVAATQISAPAAPVPAAPTPVTTQVSPSLSISAFPYDLMR